MRVEISRMILKEIDRDGVISLRNWKIGGGPTVGG